MYGRNLSTTVLCKKVVSLKLRESVYNGCEKVPYVMVLSVGLKKTMIKENCKLYIKMKMLHLICGKILKDSISNKTIREITSVEKIEGFFRE